MNEEIVLANYRNPHASQSMQLRIRLLCNTDEERIAENVRVNSAREDIRWLSQQREHDRIAVIVGGGPSAADCIEDIQALVDIGGIVFSLNGAARWLRKNGVRSHYQCIIDARPENRGFLDEYAGIHLLASQVDPSLVEASASTILMHLMSEGVEDHLPEKRRKQGGYSLLGGGFGVGNTAICAAYALGYRTLLCFGFDSSNRQGAGHAYPQPMNADIPCVETEWAGKTYVSSLPMKAHAERFQIIAHDLIQMGCEIHVHGDGLLPAMFNDKSPVFRVGCDLGAVPASFDFVTWLAAAEMERKRRGYETLSVQFQAGPRDGFRAGDIASVEQTKELFENVVRPSLSMVGAIEGEAADLYLSDYTWRTVTNAFLVGSPVPKLRPSDEAQEFVNRRLDGRRPVVITLREADYWPERNSNLPAWLEYAQGLDDVIFVRDTAKAHAPLGFDTMPEASLDLHVRLALYQRARMNLTVSTGPSVLLWLSDCPFRSFTFPVPGYLPHTEEHWPVMTGFHWGQQAPWFSENQKIVYERDTLESIRAHA